MAAVWVKFYNLPLQFFNESALIRMGSPLSTVLHIFPNTVNLSQHIDARMCIEIDVSKPLLTSFFMGTSKEDNGTVFLEYEGNNTYCTNCGLLGHTIGLCGKKYPHLAQKTSDKGQDTTQKTGKQKGKKPKVTYKEVEKTATPTNPISILKRGDTHNEKVQSILKEVGLVDSGETSTSKQATKTGDNMAGDINTVPPGTQHMNKNILAAREDVADNLQK